MEVILRLRIMKDPKSNEIAQSWGWSILNDDVCTQSLDLALQDQIKLVMFSDSNDDLILNFPNWYSIVYLFFLSSLFLFCFYISLFILGNIRVGKSSFFWGEMLNSQLIEPCAQFE